MKGHPPVPKPGRKFTLIEIILIILIGWLCFTIVGPRVVD